MKEVGKKQSKSNNTSSRSTKSIQSSFIVEKPIIKEIQVSGEKGCFCFWVILILFLKPRPFFNNNIGRY